MHAKVTVSVFFAFVAVSTANPVSPTVPERPAPTCGNPPCHDDKQEPTMVVCPMCFPNCPNGIKSEIVNGCPSCECNDEPVPAIDPIFPTIPEKPAPTCGAPPCEDENDADPTMVVCPMSFPFCPNGIKNEIVNGCPSYECNDDPVPAIDPVFPVIPEKPAPTCGAPPCHDDKPEPTMVVCPMCFPNCPKGIKSEIVNGCPSCECNDEPVPAIGPIFSTIPEKPAPTCGAPPCHDDKPEPTMVVCPMCFVYCPNGIKPEIVNGCPSCECNDDPVPAIDRVFPPTPGKPAPTSDGDTPEPTVFVCPMCYPYCPYGRKSEIIDGCPSCECNDPLDY